MWNLLAGALSVGANMLRDRKQRKVENERYKRQLKDSRNNWHMQNAYNSPSSQMARLKAAGLNPNMIYQNGAAMAGAGEIGSSDYETTPYSDYNTSLQMAIQADSVQAEIDKKIAETAGINADNVTKIEHSKHVDEETKQWLRGLQLNNTIMEQQHEFIQSQTGLTKAQTQEAILNWSKVPAEIDALRAKAKLDESSIKEIEATIKQVNANTNLITQQYQKAVIETYLMQMQQAAEQDAKESSYRLQIEFMKQQVEDLLFTNSEEWRLYQMTPEDVRTESNSTKFSSSSTTRSYSVDDKKKYRNEWIKNHAKRWRIIK